MDDRSASAVDAGTRLSGRDGGHQTANEIADKMESGQESEEARNAAGASMHAYIGP